jgi:uncharacterized OB-fold protein
LSTAEAHVFPPGLYELAPDSWTAPFWDAAKEHRLVAPRCRQCGTFRMPPTPFCPECRSQDAEWVELSGRGSIYTFTVARHAVLPALKDSVPYVIAVISLEGAGDARLITNIVGCQPEEVEIEAAVQVVWDDLTDATTVPRFILAPAG